MALFIKFTLLIAPDMPVLSNAIYVGQDVPSLIIPERVLSVQVDGQELDHSIVLAGFKPPEIHRVFHFYGDIASQIVGNWK